MSDTLRYYYFQTQTFFRRVIPTVFEHNAAHDFSKDTSPACLLGRLYLHRAELPPTDAPIEEEQPKGPNVDHLRRDFQRIVWITYRDELSPPLVGDLGNFSSDAGWGCMLRTIQMIVAEALKRNAMRGVIVEDWNIEEFKNDDIADVIALDSKENTTKAPESGPKDGFDRDMILRHVVEKFIDINDAEVAPLSLYRILSTRSPGKWYGPHEASMLISRAVQEWKQSPISLVVCQDGAIFKSDLKPPVCLLVPIRLGLDVLNPKYYELLYKCIGSPLSIGIAGGKPNSSLYFVGYHNQKLFYLDPHKLHRSPKGRFTWKFSAEESSQFQASEDLKNTFFCAEINSLAIADMDPCMSVGFYCHDEKDVENFWNFAIEISKEPYCVFSVSDAKGGRNAVVAGPVDSMIENQDTDWKDVPGSDDEFVVL